MNWPSPIIEVAILGMLMLLVSGCATGKGRTISHATKTESKMDIPNIPPDTARELLQSGDGVVYLDVRTEEEFEAGRPPGAFNIPVMVRDPSSGQPKSNDDFLKIVAAHFPRDARLIVGCRTGSRSAHATALLLQAGYENVANMSGGFVGFSDGNGRVAQPGWSTLNFPAETGPADVKSYEALKLRARH
jgi:rhodanese-related sulfurtransferase